MSDDCAKLSVNYRHKVYVMNAFLMMLTPYTDIVTMLGYI